MESNGKRVDLAGEPLPFGTSPVRLGRARHQWPARLLPDAAPGHRRDAGRVHRGEAARASPHAPTTTAKLLANCLAQAQALMQGKTAPRRGRAGAHGVADARPERSGAPPQSSPATGPSTTLAAGALDAALAGRADRAVRAPRVHAAARCGASTASTSGAWSWARRWPAMLPRLDAATRAGSTDRPPPC